MSHDLIMGVGKQARRGPGWMADGPSTHYQLQDWGFHPPPMFFNKPFVLSVPLSSLVTAIPGQQGATGPCRDSENWFTTERILECQGVGIACLEPDGWGAGSCFLIHHQAPKH